MAIRHGISQRHFHFSKSPGKHMDHFKQVLTLQYPAGRAPKFGNRAFFTDMIDYFENVIRSRRLEIAAHTAEAIKKFETTTHHYKDMLFFRALQRLQKLCL